ncbi:hypothetical protein K493DRAFT_311947 [Basidiobolus meristosporus CBS 931.73]|uniref:Uncharacterized protein n=1 Tax=Basidiobolus meristosporus CBS 931.73 TaxID=1314790 RepID=A0A1Y1YXL5_9FUNG|nr:hypothetical protein K493DRAFT_311947 [Basidiobolus meristosporus CBS 931.73]|eukprot:ORY02773.1 hypothetical protein K493DRAFT_311947 [Basidiobolus meristosporus CBS 931.73]
MASPHSMFSSLTHNKALLSSALPVNSWCFHLNNPVSCPYVCFELRLMENQPALPPTRTRGQH